MTATFNNPEVLLIAARDLGIMPGRSLPAWRTVAPARRSLPATRPRPEKSARPVRSIWIAPQRESLGEKLVMALLGVAAVAAIGFGFASLVDLVRHWAVFTNGIGQMIH
jgi:hypothetical protein